MKDGFISELEELGLSTAEAQIYVVLIKNGALGAAAIANLAGIQRSNVYPILCSLIDKGIVEGGTGYGSKFTAVQPDDALPSLIVRERETLAQREHLAAELARHMASFVNPTETVPEELIQVIRHPKVIAERYSRLQQEVERQVDGFAKAPIMTVPPGNPAQAKAQKRGVRYRALYEKAVLEEPGVKPYLKAWIDGGEEARVFDGVLPHKLIIFDQQIVLLPLVMPRDQTRTLVIRHPQLAQSLSLLFNFLWAQAKPLVLGREEKTRTPLRPKQMKKIAGKTPALARSQNNETARNGARPLRKR